MVTPADAPHAQQAPSYQGAGSPVVNPTINGPAAGTYQGQLGAASRAPVPSGELRGNPPMSLNPICNPQVLGLSVSQPIPPVPSQAPSSTNLICPDWGGAALTAVCELLGGSVTATTKEKIIKSEFIDLNTLLDRHVPSPTTPNLTTEHGKK